MGRTLYWLRKFIQNFGMESSHLEDQEADGRILLIGKTYDDVNCMELAQECV
jgi:hypothetical protein